MHDLLSLSPQVPQDLRTHFFRPERDPGGVFQPHAALLERLMSCQQTRALVWLGSGPLIISLQELGTRSTVVEVARLLLAGGESGFGCANARDVGGFAALRLGDVGQELFEVAQLRRPSISMTSRMLIK